MRKVILLLSISLILLGCDKVKRNQKHLDGTWTIYEYQYTAPTTGLIYFFESTGTMSFGNASGKNINYAIDINYLNQGNYYDKMESGVIEFQDDEYFLMHRQNSNGTITVLDYARILLITKDDLKLEFQDEYGLHEFILQK